MSNSKNKVFVYDRKELLLLVFLALALAMFSFTLGVHFGKRVSSSDSHHVAATHEPSENHAFEEQADQVPHSHEIGEQGKAIDGDIDTALKKELHDEVLRTGIQMDKSRPVTIPEKTISEKKVTTHHDTSTEKLHQLKKYTLQVGSFPTESEASDLSSSLKSNGLSPFLRRVDLSEKGIWYRVYLGGFDTVKEAELEGAKLQKDSKIKEFVVSSLDE